MSTTQTYPQLVDALDNVRRQWRQRKLLEGVLLTSALALGILVALVAADNLLALGTLGRLLTAAFLWTAVAICVLTWVVRRVLEQQRDDFFAILVEQRHPELRNRLINGLQLGRGNDFGSTRLIEAIDLGKGKRMLVKGGKLNKTYQITVPENLDAVR